MDKILIATVLKPQGLSGELKCKLENENYDIIKDVMQVYLNDKEVPTRIASKCYRSGYLYIKFNTINSREKADLLRNTRIYANREQLNIPKNEYMISDLIGLKVVGQKMEEIGLLKDIQNYGATDILVIEAFKREYMVPFINDVILSVNLKEKLIIVNKQKYDEVKICD